MAPDIPIPAPANWARLAMPATDQPVLRSGWHAVRSIEAAMWSLGVFESAGQLITTYCAVVDDFGTLQVLDNQALDRNTAYWISTYAVDAAATDWWLQSCEVAGHARQQHQAAARTRELLRPQPVTVEIVTEPPHPLCVATIVVGDDPRIDAPLYSIHVGREEAITITHAQLAALMLAGQQLCKAATRPAKAVLQ